MTYAAVTSTVKKEGSNLSIAYQFRVGEKLYSNTGIYKLPYYGSGQLVGIVLPVIYVKEDPHVCKALVLKSDFDQFGFTYPDNLKWIVQ